MAKEKTSPHKVVMTEGKRDIIRGLLSEYDIQTAQDIQEALKDLLGGTIKEMMESEMDNHLGYEKSERSDSDDYRNGYKPKTVKSRYGEVEIEVPQDRKEFTLSRKTHKVSLQSIEKASSFFTLRFIDSKFSVALSSFISYLRFIL